VTCRLPLTDILNPECPLEGKQIATSDVREQLAAHLARLWRYGLVLSRNRDIAEELVQSTCVRALEKSSQYTPGTRIDRWLFAILHSIWISEQRPAPSDGVSRRALIAASLSFLVLGSGLGYWLRPTSALADENAQIREREAQYMSLYSVETLLDMNAASPVLQRGLARAAQDIGLQLAESQLSLRGAELKMIRMLRYDATSIAQIAWLNADYGPMALCISPTEQKMKTAFQQEQRHSMNLVWWQDAGYQFVLIGRNPLPALQSNAQQLFDALA